MPFGRWLLPPSQLLAPTPELALIILVSVHAEPLCAFVYFSVFPGGPDGKESTCNALDSGSISGKGRSPREGNGNPLQYSCLENPMDRGAWRTAVCGVIKSRTERITLGILRENNIVLSWKAFHFPLNFYFFLFPFLGLSWERREVDEPA